MKYKLPRQVLSPEIKKLLYKEMKRLGLGHSRLSKKHLKELAAVCLIIEKQEFPDDLVCRKLKHNLGSGIFLRPDAKTRKKGEVIAAYSGEVSIVEMETPDDGSYTFAPIEGMKLSKDEQAFFDPSCEYNAKRRYCFRVDGLPNGNFTRYINHSDKPNIVARLVRVPKGHHSLEEAPIEVVYFAKKTIHPGEQLLVSYEDGEKSYWEVFKIKPYPMTPKTFTLDPTLRVIGN